MFLGVQRVQRRGKYNATGDQRLSYSHLPGDEVPAIGDVGGAAAPADDADRGEDVPCAAAGRVRLRAGLQRARERGQL